MATVRQVLAARLERLRQKQAQARAQVQATQAEIDAATAELVALTPTIEAQLARLVGLGIVKAED